jgi:hypothetical protein
MAQTLAYGRWPRLTIVRPAGLGFVGLAIVLLGAWAGIVGFVGPEFGYNATTAVAWSWTTTNWLLHLLPGVVAFVAGLMVLSEARALSASRGSLAMAGTLTIAAGAWLVIGPVAAHVFQSAPAYGPSTESLAALANKVGADLGPGLLLAAFGAMSLKSSVPEREVQLSRVLSAGPQTAPTALPGQEEMVATVPAATSPAATVPAATSPADTSPAETSAPAGGTPAMTAPAASGPPSAVASPGGILQPPPSDAPPSERDAWPPS